jgi:glyoxylase-like metal-dependent hydrolase (beta-lactamase superfamily II)
VVATSAVLVLVATTGVAILLRLRRGEAGPVEVLAPNLLRVQNFLSDVYAARVGEQVILFDAGMDPNGRAIDLLLRELHRTRADVTHVFLTHAHADHVAAAALFPAAEIHIGSADLDVLAHRDSARPLTPRIFGALLGSIAVEANRPLLDRRSLDVGGERVLALPFPGHTPGSFLYLFRGVLFTGDSINLDHGVLKSAVANHSVNPMRNRASIRNLFTLLGSQSVERVCTGHGGCTEPGSATPLLRALVRAQG